MKISAVLQGLAAICIAATASAVSGQNAIQLFSPANVRVSTQGTGHGDDAKTFNSTIINLKCATSPVHAVLSSSPDGNGNVLVDNFVALGVNGAGSGRHLQTRHDQNMATSRTASTLLTHPRPAKAS